MKNASKKFVTLLAMLTLVLVMSVQIALADATIGPNDGGIATSPDTTLNIVKTMTVTNPNLVQVSGPGLQYNFTLTSATVPANTVITDENGHTATVHSGPEGGLTLTTSPAFSVQELLTASASGASNQKNIVLTANPNNFTSPGIYRYVLTDNTTAAALAAAGVVRDEHYTDIRYVDVYIQDAVDSDDLVVEGYVVGSDNDGNNILVKETFDTSTTTDDTTDPTYQKYDTLDDFETYNLQLRKSVTGRMGDKNNQFEFAIAVSDSARKYYSDKTNAPSSSSTLNRDAHTTSLSTTLADNESYYIAGLTKNDTVSYTETNNTDDTYNVTITVNGTAGASQQIGKNGTKNMPATAAPSATSVVFENNHGSVSPTGVIMRFGPYIGMVLIAALLILMRKRTKTNK